MINKKIKYYKKRVDFIKRRINKTKNDKHKVMLLEELSNLVKIRNMYIENNKIHSNLKNKHT